MFPTQRSLLIIIGYDGKTKTRGFDFIDLHAKFFVYQSKLNKLKPTLETFIHNLKYTHIYAISSVHLMETTYRSIRSGQHIIS